MVTCGLELGIAEQGKLLLCRGFIYLFIFHFFSNHTIEDSLLALDVCCGEVAFK